MADQDIVLTVPASFDDAARTLTLEAARRAGLGDGIVLLDTSLRIVWFNERFRQMTDVQTALVGRDFYDTLGTPEILGPDFCPFHTALATGGTAKSTLRVDEQKYCEVHAEPISGDDGSDRLHCASA